MRKLLVLFTVACLATTTGFAQKGIFKKKDKNVEEQIDDVEEKIEKETEELKAKTEKKAPKAKEEAEPAVESEQKPAKQKAEEKKESNAKKEDTEKSAETMRKMADVKEQMQQKIKVEEKEGSVSTGLQNGYTVFIKGGSVNKIEKHWKKYLKSAFSGKAGSDKNGEILAESVEIPSVGSTVNIYARVKEVSNGAEITTFYDTGEEGYLSSANTEGHELITNIMRDFGIQERVYAIEQQIADEEKSLKRLKKDLKNLEDDNEKYHRTIEKAKLDIEENEKDQDQKNIEITEQMEIIEAIGKMKDGVE